MTTDRILAVLALLALTAFLAVLVVRVPQWDLWTVVGLVVAFTIYDFWRDLGPHAEREESSRR